MEAEATSSTLTIRSITRRYYGIWWAYSFAGGFLFGIYPIFLRSRGLNQFEINSVLATYFAVTFLTDVPTGAFADALGRRKSFLLGCAVRAAAFLLYFFAHRYLLFLIAESIDGIGTTFCNGAIDAWGVDALDDAGFEEVKDRLFSRISQLSTVGFMASSLIGAYAANVNLAWPWLLGMAGYVGAGAIGSILMRGEKARAAHIEFGKLPAMLSGRVADGLRQGFGRRGVLLLSLAGAIQVAAWSSYWMEWPLFFNDSYGVGVWIVGWLWSLFALGRLIGAEAIARFRNEDPRRAEILTGLVTAASAMLILAGLSGQRPNLVMALLFIMNLFTGAMFPLTQSWFNEEIGSEQRATLLSFNSTFATLGGSIGLLFGGWLADAFGISFAWQVAGLISLASAACYWALRPRTAAAVIATGAAD
jgi:MFS family permease